MAVVAYSIVLAALLLWPGQCAQAASEALSIWGLSVVPSLFPYMVFSRLLCAKIKNTRCPPALVCMLLGSLGGSPSGAATICAYQERLSERTILALSALTGTISPMFFLGTLSSFTCNPILCQNLLLAQTAGAVLAALCARLFPPSQSLSPKHNPSDEKAPLAQSIDAVLQIGGSIICFSVVASLLSLLPLPKALAPMLHALLEISGGAYAIIRFPFHKTLQAVLLAFFSGFGGLCILSQNLLFLKPLVSAPCLLALSLLRATLSAVVMIMLMTL